MFGGEASDKKVKTLSGGERSRLAMIRLLLEPVNLLILDEPTNHLDMASKEVLKKAISEFDGTAIIVSHDRDFLNGLITKVYEFGEKKVTEHLGGIYDFLAKKKLDNLQQLETSLSTSPVRTEDKTNDRKRENKLSYQEQKERNRQIRKLEKELQETEDKITSMEEKLSSIETELITPEGASNATLVQSYIDLKNKITASMNIWERLALEIEKLQNNQ